MTRYVPPDFTEAQVRTLTVLADGLWHDSRRASGSGRVLGTVAAELFRRGYLEREGASRTARPSNPGFRYRLNPAGQRAVRALDDARRVTPPRYRGGMSWSLSISGHVSTPDAEGEVLAILRDALVKVQEANDGGDVNGYIGTQHHGSLTISAGALPEAPVLSATEPDAEASADGTDGGEAPA